MTDKEREAKIEALNEAAEHLDHRNWSDDETELEQGLIVAQGLRRRINRLLNH